MKGSQILIDTWRGRPAAALMRDGVLDDLLIDAPDHLPRPGAIYRARAERALKGQGGWVVTLPDGPGYVRGGDGLSPGAPALVQVTGFPEPGKPVPLTNRIPFKSRYCIVTPGAPGANISRAIKDEETRVALRALLSNLDLPDDPGVILRSAAAKARDDEIASDLATMRELAGAIATEFRGPPELLLDGPTPDMHAWRDWADVAAQDVVTAPGCFDTHGAGEQIAALDRPRVDLPGGGHLFVEPTRALVAVDVNTGGTTGLAAGLKVNIAAARALPRALRLRGLGGQIVVDLAPMPKKERRGFEQALRAALRACPVETALVGWTPLGHVELSRKRERLPLAQALSPEVEQ
jgi:Ribonuclease G/E